jgi:Nucleoside-diphosphate-sugar epimerases
MFQAFQFMVVTLRFHLFLMIEQIIQFSLYAATKKSNELLANAYNEIHNLNVTGLRFFYSLWSLGKAR